jgi:hypothetical protein
MERSMARSARFYVHPGSLFCDRRRSVRRDHGSNPASQEFPSNMFNLDRGQRDSSSIALRQEITQSFRTSMQYEENRLENESIRHRLEMPREYQLDSTWRYSHHVEPLAGDPDTLPGGHCSRSAGLPPPKHTGAAVVAGPFPSPVAHAPVSFPGLLPGCRRSGAFSPSCSS